MPVPANLKLKYQTTHLLSQLSAYVAKPRDPIKAVCLQSTISKHLHHLGILLAVLLEHKLSLVVFILILASPAVLSSLS